MGVVLFFLLFHTLATCSPSPLAFPSQALSQLREGGRTGCIRVNRCKCILGDGSGVINLAELGGADGYVVQYMPLSLKDGQEDTEVLLSFNPCLPFSEPEDFTSTECADVAVCLTIRDRKLGYVIHSINYGGHTGNVFQYNNSHRILTVSYSVSPGDQIQTVVHYRCNPSRSFSASYQPGAAISLELWVDNPCSCPNACTIEDMGPGTIFLIIFCLSATAYFIAGSCALRPVRTRSGMQLSPEDGMWCVLCTLFTDRKRKMPRRRLLEGTP